MIKCLPGKPYCLRAVFLLAPPLGILLFLAFGAQAGSAGAAARGAADESGGIHWVAVDGGQVKLGGKIPIMWNLYQPDKKEKKKDNLALVLLGRRYLLLDTRGKVVYEVKLSDLHAQGKDFTSDDLTATSRVI